MRSLKENSLESRSAKEQVMATGYRATNIVSWFWGFLPSHLHSINLN